MSFSDDIRSISATLLQLKFQLDAIANAMDREKSSDLSHFYNKENPQMIVRDEDVHAKITKKDTNRSTRPTPKTKNQKKK